jgi:hypothetical protein
MQQDNQFMVDMGSRAWNTILDIPIPGDLVPGSYSIYFCGVAKNKSTHSASGKASLTVPGGTTFVHQVFLPPAQPGAPATTALNITGTINIDPGYCFYATLNLGSSLGANLLLSNIVFTGKRIAPVTVAKKLQKCQCTSSELFSKGCQCGGE